MDDEDKGFFILVLGVLAAVLMVVIWQFISDDDPLVLPAAEPVEEVAAEPEPEPTAVPEPEPTAVPEPEPTAVPEPAAPTFTVADLVGENASLTNLNDALVSTGLTAALAGDGPITVLAPTNGAFRDLDDELVSRLLTEDQAASTLQYHVVSGAFRSDDLLAAAADAGGSVEVETLQGDTITIENRDGQLVLNGSAIVSEPNQVADNGVVHSIDQVLVPREIGLNYLVDLEPIQFATGSAAIAPESEATLDQVIAALENSDSSVSIEGHTDSTGDSVLNRNLSQARAVSVLDYLVAGGIDEERLSAVGFGAEQPRADNDTEEGRALNRRIEFKIN